MCFGIGLTLREGNREYFYAALDALASQHSKFAGLKERYIRTYGNSYMVSSPKEHELMQHLSDLCRKNKIMLGGESIFKWIEEFSEDSLQPSLF